MHQFESHSRTTVLPSISEGQTGLVASIEQVLIESKSPLKLNDLWSALPTPRPGRIQLERMILIRNDLFRFDVGGAVSLVHPPDQDDGSSSTGTGEEFGPPDFKSLMRYYENCIREDGRRIRCYGSHLGVSALPTEREWVSERKGIYSIPVSSENRDIFINSSDQSTAHYYGYPLLAQWQEEEKEMKFVPILFWKLHRQNSEAQAHRLSFTMDEHEFRFNQEVLWAMPRRSRKKIEELFESAKSVGDCLEMIQADFLGLQINEVLYQGRTPKAPELKSLGARHEGVYNRGLYLSITPSSFVKGLASELSIMAGATFDDIPTSSLSEFLSEDRSPIGEPHIVVPVSRPLNAHQEAAVERALSHPLSVVTGPPGTGKSEVVVAIIANAILAGKSVLFATRNNGAITVVQERVSTIINDGRGMMRLGSDFDASTRQLFQRVLNAPVAVEQNEQDLESEAFDSQIRKLEEAFELINIYEALHIEARQAEDSFLRSLKPLGIEECSPRGFSSADLDRIERTVAEVQSADRFGSLPLFGQWLKKKRIMKWVDDHHGELTNIAKQLDVPIDRLAELSLSDHAAWSLSALQFLELFEAAALAVTSASALKELGGLDKLLERLRLPKLQICDSVRDKLDQLLRKRMIEVTAATGFAQAGQQFYDLLVRRQTPALQRIHPMKEVLPVFPSWAVSNLSACGRLPLTPGLFDLVIIDEASQCDIPSCVPLLFRAKQAVVIGDPMQLNSVTNLNQVVEKSLLAQADIPNPGAFRYSNNSIYDLAAATARVSGKTFLAQHYRCHPDIIEFANSSHWYEGNLLAVTDTSNLNSPRRLQAGITWRDVKGEPVNDPTGFWIAEEVEEITRQIENLLLDEGFEGTVGVVTPFRRMANALQEAIERSKVHQRILDAAQFRAETAHRFQGDERDVIFYAPAFHPEMPNRHRWFLKNQKNVFNVALSRARSCFVVVGDKEGLRDCDIDYLKEFVVFSEQMPEQRQEQHRANEPQRGHWEPILEKRLHEEGVSVIPQYPVGPYSLDFALIEGERRLNIEVDGEQFHKNESGMRCQRDIDRNIYVKAQGWAVRRFWVYQLRDDMDSCVKEIKQWLTEKN